MKQKKHHTQIKIFLLKKKSKLVLSPIFLFHSKSQPSPDCCTADQNKSSFIFPCGVVASFYVQKSRTPEGQLFRLTSPEVRAHLWVASLCWKGNCESVLPADASCGDVIKITSPLWRKWPVKSCRPGWVASCVRRVISMALPLLMQS